MNFLKFKSTFLPLVCFSTNQIVSVFPDFNSMNLTRWVKQGDVVRLRRGWFSFPEFQKDIDFVRLAANRIYRPSYISLQYALSFYGMIPESVVQFTSVTTLKTANFENLWGQFSYQNVKESLMFGYEPHVVSHPLANGQAFMMATPEKALLDFLYLNPYYNKHDELEELRLDEDFMTESLNRERLLDFLQKFKSKILDKRINNLLEIYG